MPEAELRVGGAVLCGGRSRRMGADKAFLEIAGVPLVLRVRDALAAAGCTPIVAVGGDLARLRSLGLAVVADDYPGEGPLGALITAMRALGEDADVVVALATDLADADARAVRAVLAPLRDGAIDVALPRSAHRRHMHHAAWHTRCLPILEASFANGERAPRRVLDQLVVHDVWLGGAIDPAWFVDLDEPHELAARLRHQEKTTGSTPQWSVGASLRRSTEGDRVDVPEVDVETLVALRERGAVLFDVREIDEFTDGHVPGAIHVALSSVPDEVGQFPVEGPAYVICAAGGRSRKACEFLRAAGIDAINIAGGTKAWVAAGHPVATGSDAG